MYIFAYFSFFPPPPAPQKKERWREKQWPTVVRERLKGAMEEIKGSGQFHLRAYRAVLEGFLEEVTSKKDLIGFYLFTYLCTYSIRLKYVALAQ